MNGANEIWDELRSLSAVVASIDRQTPYMAPEGYFNGIADRILERVTDWKESKSLIYRVPEGYFDQFAQGVLDRIRSGTGATAADRTAADRVPAGERDDADPVSAILAGIGRAMPYQAPEGYFEALSPVLALCRDKNPYAVPEGYFERFPNEVRTRTAQVRVFSPAGRIGRVRSMGWMKYSAAAVLAGLIFTVGWLRWSHSGPATKPAFDVAALSKVSDAELQSFLTDQDTTLAQPLSNTTATIDMNDTDLKTLLGEIPDGELKQYMEEHGGASDIATN
jgi:hypothetical protein